MKSKKAFTLIELLVVIAIIGILATVSIISLTNARAKSRDAKRAGDVKQIQTALELFFNDKNRYPTADEWNTGQIFSTSTAGTSTYLQIIPTAATPADGSCTTNGNSFIYASANDNTYTLSYCLGNTTGTLTPGLHCATPGGLDDGTFCCGQQVVVTTVAGHTCNTGAPDYDKCTYDTVQVGAQCWLKDNINIGSMIDQTADQADADAGSIEKYCFNNHEINPDPGNYNDCNDGGACGGCSTDGGLYQWHTIMALPQTCDWTYAGCASQVNTPYHQGICPDGWHIPTTDEWHTLVAQFSSPPGDTNCSDPYFVGGCSPAGTVLTETSSSHFAALASGIRRNRQYDPTHIFYYYGNSSIFWTAKPTYWPANPDGNFSIDIVISGANVVASGDYKDSGFSARCIKD